MFLWDSGFFLIYLELIFAIFRFYFQISDQSICVESVCKSISQSLSVSISQSLSVTIFPFIKKVEAQFFNVFITSRLLGTALPCLCTGGIK